MLLLLIPYVYICYRWTKRIARGTEVRGSKLSFVTAVCLKMSWRIFVLSYLLVLIVAAAMASQALPGQVEAASRRGAEAGIALQFVGILLSLLVAVFTALSAFRRRSTFYILHGGQQQGPFSIAQIRQMRLQNTITENTAYRSEGLSEWRPIAELEAALKLAQRKDAAMATARERPSEKQQAPKPPLAQSPASIARTSESGSSLEKELRTLAALKSEGIISEEEFAAKKRALLGI